MNNLLRILIQTRNSTRSRNLQPQIKASHSDPPQSRGRHNAPRPSVFAPKLRPLTTISSITRRTTLDPRHCASPTHPGSHPPRSQPVTACQIAAWRPLPPGSPAAPTAALAPAPALRTATPPPRRPILIRPTTDRDPAHAHAHDTRRSPSARAR